LLPCVLLLLSSGSRLGTLAQDLTQGMNCVTQGDFEYCEGKSESYNKLANEAQDGGLNTRIMGGQNDLLTRNYGMSSPSSCDANFNQRCQQVSANILPTYLVNGRNQGRYILQMGAFQQTVVLAVCTGDKVCGQYGFCEQNYVNVQLLSWDPTVRYPVLLVDHFRIPSCCKCQRGGSRPGGPWRWD